MTSHRLIMRRQKVEGLVDFQLNVDTDTIAHLSLAEPTCVTGDTSVRDVVRVLQQHGASCALIVESEKVQGIFTERDALNQMASANMDVHVREVMIPDVVVVEKSDTVADAIEKMSQGGYRRLPVVENGSPRGILVASAILHYLVEHFPKLIYNLPPEPHHSPKDREGA